jgi:hypothetical protein
MDKLKTKTQKQKNKKIGPYFKIGPVPYDLIDHPSKFQSAKFYGLRHIIVLHHDPFLGGNSPQLVQASNGQHFETSASIRIDT